jgi:hypothetical protein
MLLALRGPWNDGTIAPMYRETMLINKSIFQISTLVCSSSMSNCNLLIDYYPGTKGILTLNPWKLRFFYHTKWRALYCVVLLPVPSRRLRNRTVGNWKWNLRRRPTAKHSYQFCENKSANVIKLKTGQNRQPQIPDVYFVRRTSYYSYFLWRSKDSENRTFEWTLQWERSGKIV